MVILLILSFFFKNSDSLAKNSDSLNQGKTKWKQNLSFNEKVKVRIPPQLKTISIITSTELEYQRTPHHYSTKYSNQNSRFYQMVKVKKIHSFLW